MAMATSPYAYGGTATPKSSVVSAQLTAAATRPSLIADVLPGELVWAAGFNGSEGIRAAFYFWLRDWGSDEYLRGGKYGVPHYPPEAVGRALGPLALDQTLRFCQVLGDRLETHKSVAICTPPGDGASRANAAVLLGGYLVLRRGWSAARVASALPQEADVLFPCSWSGAVSITAVQPEVMRVADCWAGLELACNRGWLTADTWDDPLKTSLACSQYRRMAIEYDATWLWPGRVVVAADPMSTINDPNPATCSAMFPESEKVVNLEDLFQSPPDLYPSPASILKCVGGGRAPFDFEAGSTSSATASEVMAVVPQRSVASSCPTHREVTATGFGKKGKTVKPLKQSMGDQGQPDFELDMQSESSCHTVCKDYEFSAHVAPVPVHKPKDFITWCKDRSIVLVVRVNRGDESGLLEHGGSYDPEVMKRSGIAHLDLPVPDKHGGVPDAKSIHTMLQRVGAEGLSESRSGDREPAVLIHCKGGFGRSVIFACCLLIWQHDVPGRALLGWVRIARPGAITTPQQERFLCRLGGRMDLQRYLAQHNNACCAIS